VRHRLGANRVAWARRIAHRHRRAGAWPRRAFMALAHRRPSAFHATNPHAHRTTVVTHVHPESRTVFDRRVVDARESGPSFTPAATVLRTGRDRTVLLAPMPGANVAPAASRLATLRTLRSAPAPVGTTASAHVAATVQRIVRRHERVEATSRSTQVDRTRVDVAAEVARVLTPPASFPDSSARRGADTNALATPGRAAAAAVPSIDIDGLTDRIVTRLDDRLIAHRERLGHAF